MTQKDNPMMESTFREDSTLERHVRHMRSTAHAPNTEGRFKSPGFGVITSS